MGPQSAGMGPLVTQPNRLENMGLVDDSSPGGETMTQAVKEDVVNPTSMPESYCCPSKELVWVDSDIEGRAGTPSGQKENGSDERILGEMPSTDPASRTKHQRSNPELSPKTGLGP
ncbi:uncharacterized protein A4U43_C04F20980 [Asparagus officinalis]|uniref:Uncharacterized protein n=1 Tax=Asparagus officinalis TaxID=4686 RepID=A0A5P1F792_ASPOF|nr:uncharacterized protein A4U43_C04F20980 [Asparagus officinalis]